jgi:hypothetical protein
MTWTCYRGPVTCGSCRQTIAAGEPVALLCDGKFKRCPSCAGVVVDVAQVDAAKFAIEAEDAARAEAPVPVSFATRRPEDGFVPLGAIRQPSEPTPFHKLDKDTRSRDARARGGY